MACPLIINKNSVKSLAAWWLSNESSLNYVGLTPKSGRGKVYIDMHSPGIIVGMPFVDAILKESSCEIEWHVCEGQVVKTCPTRVATVTGANEDIFFCENLVLSVLSRASGIASLASRIQTVLHEISWPGTMYMPDRRTPGFGLVEEYAMMTSGVSERRPSVSVRCQDTSAENLKTAIDKVRSRVGSIPVHVACSKLNEALLAAGAGADILLTGLDDKDVTEIATQVKGKYPKVQVIVSGVFDESDIRLCASRHVDLLTSLKLCNGYACIDFQMTYLEGIPTKEIQPEDCAVLPDEIESPTPPKPKSPGPQPTEEVDSSISAPLKKSRLVVDEGNIPKSTKLNGTPTRNTNPTASDANWSNAASAQNQKRSQRVLRHPQYTPPQRTNVPRSQSPSGMQFFNMANPRLIPPTSAASRTPAMLLQSGLNLNNQISGVLHPPNNQQNVGMRFPIVAPQLQQPPQSMSQRMPTNPTNVLNSNQPIAGGFLNHIQPPCHNTQPQNWQMTQGGASGHPMGGLNLGMRVGNPGGQNMNTCR
ncbi:unnamed protein product [Trichobilharzia szidati]|nr:unnamed protein product [Trichobilharzia szidati]